MLVHHGYKRPGYGFIVGDCYGARKTPHELSPELAKNFLGIVEFELEGHKATLDALETGETLELPVKVFDGYGIGGPKYKTVMVPRTVPPEDGYDMEGDREAALALYKTAKLWKQAYDERVYSLEKLVKLFTKEVGRLTELIETWELTPLTSIEEEKSAKQAAKAVREAAKAAKKQVKLDATIAKLQKRIDSAVRNKNSNTLAEIWKDSPRKLQEILPMSYEEAVAKLDRVGVWAAFGLAGLPRATWNIGSDHPAHSILEGMKRRMDRIKGGTQYWTGKDEREQKWLTKMTYEWPEALGGENKKGAETLAEVQAKLS